jgi:hypothetical protein
MPDELGETATVARAEGWVEETLGSEVVMLDPARDRYLRLNRTGGLLWTALEKPATVAELTERLATAEEIPADRAKVDVLAFLTKLMEQGAVQTRS